MTVLNYLPKFKRGLGLAFWAYFLHVFFHEDFPYLIFYQLTKKHFPSEDIKQNVFLNSCLAN